ncbi:MAG TPA: penicillin-binding protein 2 [Saprospiraceae bacterium]|nr:penicillin-binding protein 2 [Saprospiraceae bacterium]
MITDLYRNRQLTIRALFLVCALILIAKAAHLQLLDDTFRQRAEATAIQKYTIYPARGLIYDRDSNLLIYNTPVFDLMVTYNQVDWKRFDTLRFCQLLDISKSFFEQNIVKDWRDPRFSRAVPFVFMSKVNPEIFARFQESLYEFPGFFVQVRNARGYPHQNAAHMLGYIREVNPTEIERYPDIYQMGDYIGASGLEKSYENLLRGEKGTRYVLKDNFGRNVGAYKNGDLDAKPVSGVDVFTSISLELQQYGELLMQNKIGSIVAIEPASGEILAMVSSPGYDPNLLTINQNRGYEYGKLLNDPLNPLLDRSVQAMYPPGSLFKPAIALIALQEGVLTANRTIGCGGAYYLGGQRLTGCHGHPTCTSPAAAIQYSCNAYFVTVFRDIVDKFGFYNPQKGLDVFNDYLNRMGLGKPLGVDFPNEKGGNYPTSKYYNRIFEQQQPGQKWNSVWVRSVGIGQGEMLLTTMQMANLGALIANRGYYFTPHFIKKFRNSDQPIPEAFRQQNYIGIDKAHFDLVVNGMEGAVTGGTARVAYLSDIPTCGKTGTAENPHGKDHSIFFGFAPKENPRIAIAVYVENAGFGATFAAPIASLMMEKYLTGTIRPARQYLEDRIMNANLVATKP